MANASGDGRELNRSNRQALIEMAQGYFRGKVLCAAVRLGVAEVLADGPRRVDEIAAATTADSGALWRLLRTLASIGVVEEIEPARFALTAFGDPLRRNAPNSVWASMIFWSDLLADAWTYLPDCIRTGDRSGAEAARARTGVTSRWSQEPDAPAIFHAVFGESTADDFAGYVAAWDFSHCRVVADLGGAGGGLLAAVLAANVAAKGILVDRQEAVDQASKRFETSGLAARCECLSADLLESVPAGADVYMMRYVLHGYDDISAARILANVRRAMDTKSRLLLIEVVLPNQISRADPELEKLLMSDLNMLAVTGGRERSENEWRNLLATAGLEIVRVVPVTDQSTGIIEVSPGIA